MSQYFLVMRVPVTRGAVPMNDWLVECRDDDVYLLHVPRDLHNYQISDCTDHIHLCYDDGKNPLTTVFYLMWLLNHMQQ